jgi:hypothetical protein
MPPPPQCRARAPVTRATLLFEIMLSVGWMGESAIVHDRFWPAVRATAATIYRVLAITDTRSFASVLPSIPTPPALKIWGISPRGLNNATVFPIDAADQAVHFSLTP